jgi:SAM-dependent methyltransferase
MIDTQNTFDSVAEHYGDLYTEFYAGMKTILNEELYREEGIERVLDVGGGGKSPEQIFDDSLLKGVKLFVSNDISVAMLNRSKDVLCINSDGFHPPFAGNSFDTVLIYGCLHHLSHRDYSTRIDRARAFLLAIKQVLGKDGHIYIEEPTVDRFFEALERFILFPFYRFILRKPVPIYMYRSSELEALLQQVFDCEVLTYRRTGRVVGSAWKLSTPFLFFRWFKIPVFLIPYRYLLCRAKC